MAGSMDNSFLCVNGHIGGKNSIASDRIRRRRPSNVGSDRADGDAADMIMPNIIEVKWFTGKGSVGIVLTKTEYAGLKAFIGVGLDVNEEYDSEFIARYGTKIPRHIAAAYFPKRIKEGVIYDGKIDKKPKSRQNNG